ncbi:hypothetical protein D9M68_961730 [compost metagenome]
MNKLAALCLLAGSLMVHAESRAAPIDESLDVQVTTSQYGRTLDVPVPAGWNIGVAKCEYPMENKVGCTHPITGGPSVFTTEHPLLWPEWLKVVAHPTAEIVGLITNNRYMTVSVVYLYKP